MSDNFHFIYTYGTEENQSVRVIYKISDYWIMFREGDLSIEEDKKLSKMIEFTSSGSTSHPPSEEKLKKYATLFYQKTEKYFKKTNSVMLGDSIQTKVVRMSGGVIIGR